MMSNPLQLTPEESLQIDSSLMTSQERFSTRVAVYALRVLKQMAAETPSSDPEGGLDPDRLCSPQEIRHWLQHSAASRALLSESNLDWDEPFLDFWTQLIDSAQRSLQIISQKRSLPLNDLTFAQVVEWFEAQAKEKIDAQRNANPAPEK